MHDKYLKVRLTTDQYSILKIRAANAGKRLGTFAREQLERESTESDVTELLTKIELAISKTSTNSVEKLAVTLDFESRRVLQEILLLGRESALDANAQILQRVTAQLSKFC
jgi:hypothetical protein